MMMTMLKMTVRRLVRERLYSFLNIFGLALGVASVVLIALFVQDETSYDSFHKNLNRIYRVNSGMRGDGQPTNANGQIATGPALARVYPQIDTYVRFRKFGWNESRVVSYNNRRFYEKRFVLADSTVFRVFSFPFLQGDPATALNAPRSVVLTESMARKYFGSEPPLGKSILVDMNNDGTFFEFAVTGVLQDLPAQSSIQFDFLASLSSQTDRFFPWSLESIFTFVLLRSGTDVSEITSTLPGFITRQRGSESSVSLHLQPLSDVHLHSPFRGQMEPPGDISTVVIFSTVAAFILLIACINFINLSTARSIRRAREVGMRKVLGAYRRQLIRQFIAESVFVTTLSVLIGLILADMMLPGLNAISEKSLNFSPVWSPGGIGFLVLLCVITGIGSSMYPAYLLSSFSPLDVMRAGSIGKGGGAVVRKGLVVLQFTISVALLIGTAVAYRQMNLIRTKNLGFDKEQVMVLPLNNEIRQKVDVIRNELTGYPGIVSMSASEQVPGRAGNGSGYIMEGMTDRDGANRLFVDFDFLKTYHIQLDAGRDFSKDRPRDPAEAFLVNEYLLHARGFTSPSEIVGKTISMFFAGAEKKGTVIGVVHDFHIVSLHDNIQELFLTMMPLDHMNFISVRISPDRDLEQTLSFMKSVWSRESPSYPFSYYFVDEDFERIHRADQQTGEVFAVFACFALLAACLGLFGLASYSAEQRTKEVGIRKVLGASMPGVVSLLVKEFALMVGAAILLSLPLAYLTMGQWLDGFAYRTTMEWWLFALAGALAMLIAALTVGVQAFRAARTNPVEALRYE